VKEQISEPCPHCGRKDGGFLDKLETSSYYIEGNCIIARGKNDTIEEIKVNWWDEDEEKKVIDDISSYADKGYEVAYIAISNHDERTRLVMNVLIDSEKLVIIHNGDE
jgi:kynurenine formamidase